MVTSVLITKVSKQQAITHLPTSAVSTHYLYCVFSTLAFSAPRAWACLFIMYHAQQFYGRFTGWPRRVMYNNLLRNHPLYNYTNVGAVWLRETKNFFTSAFPPQSYKRTVGMTSGLTMRDYEHR